MTKKMTVLGLLLSLLFVSCTDFFTTSWASWAARDPSNLIRNVSAGNVDEYITMAENNPDLSMEVLNGIGGAIGSASGEDKTKLQNAAVTAAVNASDLTNTLMNNVAEISNLENADDVKDLIAGTLNDMNNLTPASDALTAILPDPGDTEAFDAFTASASAEDLAMAAALILAGEAKKSGEEIFTDYETAAIPPESQHAVDLAEALAVAALDKQPAGGENSNLLDLLTKLGFQPTPPPPPPPLP
jgi:hypothetical protein